jgi:hypothetical protein
MKAMFFKKLKVIVYYLMDSEMIRNSNNANFFIEETSC